MKKIPIRTKSFSRLVEGRTIDEVIEMLKGIECGVKGTSCPDQVARALENYKKNNLYVQDMCLLMSYISQRKNKNKRLL